MPAAEIAQAAARIGRDPGPGRFAAGLTTTTVQGSIGYTLATLAGHDGETCIALREVQARLENREVTILVDGRYPRGSCQRRAILAHERQHVRINVEALQAGARRLRQALTRVAEAWQREGGWRQADARAEIAAALEAELDRAVAVVREHAGPRHAELDSVASYAAIQSRCTAW